MPNFYPNVLSLHNFVLIPENSANLKSFNILSYL